MPPVRCSLMTMTIVVLFLFSLNTFMFLEQTQRTSYQDARRHDPERHDLRGASLKDDVTEISLRKHTNRNLSTSSKRARRRRSVIGESSEIKGVSPNDSNQTVLTDCMALLIRQGYLINNARNSRPFEPFEDADLDIHHRGDTVNNAGVGESKSRDLAEADRRERLNHSAILRTDDKRTKVSTPWGRIPDECAEKEYGNLSDSFAVSVIICFHDNEVISDILHTIHSVVQRTPRQLIREILLVDDYSKKEDFKQILELYVSAVFVDHTVRIIRSDKHTGLIQCRLQGARLATGNVLYFMDSHMEVQPIWLEPLLWEIKQDPTTLATSYLDWMEQDVDGNWSYSFGSSSWKTYFDWNFVFGFQITSQQAKSPDITAPVRCPVTVGGVFAISRDFFFEVGAFDEGMWGWGGENLDLPIRVWLFGGRVVNVPCSHVGHVETLFGRSYRLSWRHRTNVNYKRVTEVWLGEYKKYIYYYNPAFKEIDAGNLTSRLEVQRKAKYSFDWILENVYPELGLYDRKTLAYDGIRNLQFNTCLWAKTPRTHPYLSQCNKTDTSHQGFFLNELGELRFPIHVFNAYSAELRMYEYIRYYQVGTASRWIHWPGGPLHLYSSNQCLEAADRYRVVMAVCDKDKLSQRWMFNSYSNKLYELLKSKPSQKENYFWYVLYLEHLQTDGNTTINYEGS